MRLERTEDIDLSRESSKQGLTSTDAKKRLDKYGYNELEAKKKTSAFKILLGQLNDFMTWVLLGATLISGIMGEKADAITILIIILINGILGFIQEFKTEKSLEALKNLASPTAKVIRDGKVITLNAREIVPGDILEIEAGDRISADSVIIDGFGIQSDESILTGESAPVEKTVHKSSSNKDKSSLYMGCTVISGRAKAKVIATGMNTEMGKIAGMLGEIETKQTPLQEKLDNLGKVLVIGCLIVCAAVTITGIVRGEDAYRMFLVGVSLAVAAIPEGLPAIVTVSLALGVQRMMKKKALVRKLQAVETLGCTKVICSDKTGTLTQNKMTIKKLYTLDQFYNVSGNGYDIKGDIKLNGHSVNISSNFTLKRIIECGVICNNSSISNSKKGRHFGYIGDPTEISFTVLGQKVFGENNKVKENVKRIKENPFDSDRKMMSVLCSENGRNVMFTKGAAERVIERCSYAIFNGEVVKLTSSLKEKILKSSNDMAQEALRVLALAYKDADSIVEDNLIFLGLAGMIDPPREEVKSAILECRLAGITPVMITGDHKLTAHAIADKLGMVEKDSLVLTGEELDKISDTKLDNILNKVRVFARVSPSHKYRIVKAFKRKNQVVAMTGDGVNDAPAIKEADIGIAMGIQGTDVTKEASSMILLDDNFTTIVEAVKEGRVIYDNIRKFLRYLLSCNIGEVLTMFVASLMSLPIPLLPIQILLVNLATDGLPAMALSLEKGEKDVMMRKAREKNEGIFANGLWSKIVLRGALIGVSTVVSFVVTLVYFNGNLEVARTVALCTLVMSQLFHVFECRSERNSVFSIGLFSNIYLVLAVISSFTLLMLIVYMPWLQGIFHTQSLNILNWVVVLSLSGLISLISSLLWHKK